MPPTFNFGNELIQARLAGEEFKRQREQDQLSREDRKELRDLQKKRLALEEAAEKRLERQAQTSEQQLIAGLLTGLPALESPAQTPEGFEGTPNILGSPGQAPATELTRRTVNIGGQKVPVQSAEDLAAADPGRFSAASGGIFNTRTGEFRQTAPEPQGRQPSILQQAKIDRFAEQKGVKPEEVNLAEAELFFAEENARLRQRFSNARASGPTQTERNRQAALGVLEALKQQNLAEPEAALQLISGIENDLLEAGVDPEAVRRTVMQSFGAIGVTEQVTGAEDDIAAQIQGFLNQ